MAQTNEHYVTLTNDTTLQADRDGENNPQQPHNNKLFVRWPEERTTGSTLLVYIRLAWHLHDMTYVLNRVMHVYDNCHYLSFAQ